MRGPGYWSSGPFADSPAGEVKEFLGSKAGRGIGVEPLPAYAPDLNPWDQGAEPHLKHVAMRNPVGLDREALHMELHLAIGRLRQEETSEPRRLRQQRAEVVEVRKLYFHVQ
jgi:hypothetical protein